jgi:hypothetical protein
MKFPQHLLRFLYWIFFKPFSLHAWIRQIGPGMGNTAALLTSSHDRSDRSLNYLALFYILVMPWLMATGTGVVLAWLGMDVNWLRLVFTLSMAMALSLTFSIDFGIAFLLPFSIAVAIWSSTSFTGMLGIFFTFTLGTAYGLSGNSARWGLTAGLVYGVLLSIILGPLSGLSIAAAFLLGYFRILFYLVEASLSWVLGNLARNGEAVRLWRFHPVVWDELIWFPLPGLDEHLLAIQRQDEPALQAAIHQVQESFRQSGATQRVLEQRSEKS